MTTKHSPAPWRIVGADGYATGIWDAKAKDVVAETAPMKQEDAQLIAAAPEMYAAIRKLVEREYHYHHDQCPSNFHKRESIDAECKCAVADLRKALALAEASERGR